MLRAWKVMLLAALPLVAGSCGAVQTFVALINATNFPVDGRLFYHPEQSLPESGIELLGTEVAFNIEPGQTFTFSRDCDDLQAIFIKDADMRVAPGVSPETDSEVYREPTDFSCGRTLTFTFTQNLLGTELNVAFTLAP